MLSRTGIKPVPTACETAARQGNKQNKPETQSGGEKPLDKGATKATRKQENNKKRGLQPAPADCSPSGKDGGLLLSRIALQYHRRRRA